MFLRCGRGACGWSFIVFLSSTWWWLPRVETCCNFKPTIKVVLTEIYMLFIIDLITDCVCFSAICSSLFRKCLDACFKYRPGHWLCFRSSHKQIPGKVLSPEKPCFAFILFLQWERVEKGWLECSSVNGTNTSNPLFLFICLGNLFPEALFLCQILEKNVIFCLHKRQ